MDNQWIYKKHTDGPKQGQQHMRIEEAVRRYDLTALRLNFRLVDSDEYARMTGQDRNSIAGVEVPFLKERVKLFANYGSFIKKIFSRSRPYRSCSVWYKPLGNWA